MVPLAVYKLVNIFKQEEEEVNNDMVLPPCSLK